MKKIKNICLVTSSLVGGGAEKLNIILHKYLLENGFNSHYIVLSSSGCDYNVNDLDNIYFLDQSYKKPFFGFMDYSTQAKALSKMIKEIEGNIGGFDVIVASLFGVHHLFNRLKFDNVLYFVLSSPLIESMHSKSRLRGLRDFLAFRSVYKNKKIIGISKGISQEFIDIFKLDSKLIHSVNSFLDYSEIDRLLSTATDDELGRFKDKKFIVHVGRFSSQKRHDVLFESYLNSGVNIPLVLVTKESIGLTNLINKYGLSEKVFVTGFTQNPYIWIKNSELLLLTSDYEGFPNVMLEALYVKTHVIASDCRTGPSEILTGDLQRWLVNKNDPILISNKIKEFFEDGNKSVPSFDFSCYQVSDFVEEISKLID